MENANIPFELDLLSKGENFLQWIYRAIEPFLGQRILELGSGIGNLSKLLPVREKLILSEPDLKLFKILQRNIQDLSNSDSVDKIGFEPFDLEKDAIEVFGSEDIDSVVSVNVFEHLKNDEKCIEKISNLLRKSKSTRPKNFIIFVPAHNWAYGSLDKKFGHYRRYSKKRMKSIFQKTAPEASLQIFYFNIFSLGLWLINGRLLKVQKISEKMFGIFDWLTPYFSPIDRFLHRMLKIPLGQSLICIATWK